MDARGAGQNALSILECIKIEESTPAESIIGGEYENGIPATVYTLIEAGKALVEG